MVITNQPYSSSKVVPISRARTSEPRPAEVVLAALHAENQRHAAVRDSLLGELAGMPPGQAGTLGGVPPGELRETKKQAAASLDITPERLMRFIGRYHVDHPKQPKLGVQPGGSKYGRWIINTERVKRVRDSGEPY